MQKLQPPKQQQAAQQNTNAESLSLNSQARQELHRHLNEMKAIAQSTAVAAQQTHNPVTSKFEGKRSYIWGDLVNVFIDF